MIIVAGGDSFVYGSELADTDATHLFKKTLDHPGYTPPSKYTFTALLGADVCVALPGYANDSISRTVIAECEKHADVGVIVSWTFPGRYEFRFNYDTEQRTGNWYAINSWTIGANFNNVIKDQYIVREANSATGVEILTKDNTFSTETYSLAEHVKAIRRAEKTGVADFAKTFYRHVGSSEYWEIYSSLKEIVYLQNYLKVNNIPYMFTCADNSILYNYTVSSADQVISSLYNQIDMEQWFWFPLGVNPQDTRTPRGFYQWAVENKYPMGATHPLEQAHLDASKLMQEKFDELVTKHIQ